jgi:hypothetical protein
MQIVLKGLPEQVQELADMLDRLLPDAINWRSFAQPGQDHRVSLTGSTRSGPRGDVDRRFSGKGWKRSAQARGLMPRPEAYCASLSKSFPDQRAGYHVTPVSAEKVEQSGQEVVDIAKAGDRDQVIIAVGFEQFEVLNGA